MPASSRSPLLRLALSVVVCVALLSCGALAQDRSVVSKQVGPGVTLTQIKITAPTPLLVNMVTVDLSIPDIDVRAAIAKDVVYADDPTMGREAISSIVARSGALLGVNADYFPMTWAGDPLGVCIIDGELISEPFGTRAAFAFTKDRRAMFDIPVSDCDMTVPGGSVRKLDGLNRARNTGETVLYTQRFGSSIKTKYAGTDVVLSSSDLPTAVGKTLTFKVEEVRLKALNTPIPECGAVLSGGGPSAEFLSTNLKVGDTIAIRFGVKSGSGLDWSKVSTAVGGGPFLLKGGVEFMDGVAEAFSDSLVNGTHPRTAVGVVGDSKLVLVTCDGRQPFSAGLDLKGFARLLQGFGITDAMNLDGGGSTTMSVAGMIVNSPCEGIERLVANALLVFGKTKVYDEIEDMALSADKTAFVSGKSVRLSVASGTPPAPCAVSQQRSVIWGTRGGIGFVDQSGVFTPAKARQGAVCAMYGTDKAAMDVTVVAGDVARVDVTAAVSESDSNAWAVTASAQDSCGNPTPGRSVTITASGATADQSTGLTDATGRFVFNVTTAPDAKDRQISVKVDNTVSSVKLQSGG